MFFSKKNYQNSAFSIVELLIVILVIGIITAIAVPSLGRMEHVAHESKNRSNARAAVAICASAKVAGYDFVANAAQPTSQHWVLRALAAGSTISDPGGPFDGSYFGMPGLGLTAIYGAQPFLEVVDGELRYNPAGDSIDPVEPLP